MTTLTFFEYSVGGFTLNGHEISGGVHRTIEDARRALDHFRDQVSVASMSIYGWTEDGGVEEIDGFCRD